MSNLLEQLQEPFEPSEVKWKPQAVKNDRALAVAYVDARVVMDRLDDVFGVGGWQKSHHVLPTGLVTCKLCCRIDDEWIEKEDIGDISEQPSEGDKEKSAFSDSLKRAAVCFGIGRYLYRLPMQWVDYDAQKRQFKSTPQLPKWALPSPKQAAPPPAPVKAAVPTPTAPITAAEWSAIQERADRHGMTTAKLLERFKVTRFEQITRDQLTRANDYFAKIEATAKPVPATVPQDNETPIDDEY